MLNNIVNQITVSDWIQIIIAIITLGGIISSIVIAVKTLKQNSRMIEETSRPNIIIYKDTLNINSPISFIVIKNIGGSLAHITSIHFDNKLVEKLNWHSQDVAEVLNMLNDSYIAPQQFYRIPIDIKDITFKTISINVSYTNGIKSYNDCYTLSLKQDSKIALMQQHQSRDELKVISNAIQELIKRLT